MLVVSWRGGSALRSVSFRRIAPSRPVPRVKAGALVLTRSVRACGCAPRAASARALVPSQLVALHASRRLRRADFFHPASKGEAMSTTTTRTSNDTTEAQFLAPETHQRAGVEARTVAVQRPQDRRREHRRAGDAHRLAGPVAEPDRHRARHQGRQAHRQVRGRRRWPASAGAAQARRPRQDRQGRGDSVQAHDQGAGAGREHGREQRQGADVGS